MFKTILLGQGGQYWIREAIELGKVIHWAILTLGPSAYIEVRRMVIESDNIVLDMFYYINWQNEVHTGGCTL